MEARTGGSWRAIGVTWSNLHRTVAWYDIVSRHQVGALAIRHYANSNADTTVASTSYQLSVSGTAWTTVAQPNPGTVNEVDVEVSPPLTARFVRVVHTLVHQVCCWQSAVPVCRV